MYKYPPQGLSIISGRYDPPAAAELCGGGDPVHPSDEAYSKIAIFPESDLANTGAMFTNPPTTTIQVAAKKIRVDLSQHRDEWVSGCAATVDRKDIQPKNHAMQ
jgi:hypothetical protein